MNLPPVIKQRFFDHTTGAPLAGGQVFTYQAGTTTPQATYTDQTGGTPNANPIVLDANGECSMWLDPSLSYKFVLEDSLGNVQWTVDNVIGLLTANAVNTASIQDGAITSAKLAAGAVNSTALLSDSSVDANRPVNTNNIRDSAIIRSKFNTSSLPVLSFQKFTTGTGTYNPTYVFFVSAANATTGATYTNNGQTYTVVNTISGGAILQGTGTGVPQTSGTLTKTSGTGDASIAFSYSLAPGYIRVRMVGAGGGGGGSGTSSGDGGAGGNTTFGTSLLVANGGAGGKAGPNNGFGGIGGTASLGTGPLGIALPGTYGNAYTTNASGAASGGGGNSVFAGAGGSVIGTSGGTLGNVNSGSGASGGVNGAAAAPGGGGGSGGYVDAIIISPSTSYAYAVGAGGVAGAAGSGSGGGIGGSGLIMVEEFYQ